MPAALFFPISLTSKLFPVPMLPKIQCLNGDWSSLHYMAWPLASSKAYLNRKGVTSYNTLGSTPVFGLTETCSLYNVC